MRLQSTIRNHLLSLALLACALSAESHAWSQTGANANSSLALTEKKWAAVSDADLLKAVNANDPEAQYFYWRRENDKARREQDQLWQEGIALKYSLPGPRQKAFWEKWKNATDAEVAQAVQQGDVEAKTADDLRKSNAAAERVVKLFGYLEKSAEQGFAPAEGEAASYYLNVAGFVVTDVNQAKGLELMRRSADHGWASAQFQLAEIYLHGRLVPPDIAKAVEYFQKAADQDGPRSQYELAMLYANGCGSPRSDGDSSVALLRKSAAKDNVPALHELAEHYRIGWGTTMDYVQAARYYQKASQVRQNGGYDPYGTGEAIEMLVDSNLTPKPGLTRELSSFAKVAAVYLKATTQQDAEAMRQIGQWYLDGRFVPQDNVEAFRWFRLAAQGGAPGAQERQDEIKSKLSPDELEKALRPLEN